LFVALAFDSPDDAWVSEIRTRAMDAAGRRLAIV